MIEFNPDGSLKLPDSILKKRQETEYRMKRGECIVVRKEVIKFTAPKKCMLYLRLSENIKDNRFVEMVYRQFNEKADVPSKITKVNEKEFQVEIGTHFKRCSDCKKFIERLREFLDGNVIEENGNCTFEGRKNFSYEDHFE